MIPGATPKEVEGAPQQNAYFWSHEDFRTAGLGLLDLGRTVSDSRVCRPSGGVTVAQHDQVQSPDL